MEIINIKYRRGGFIIAFLILFATYTIPNFHYRFIAIGIFNFVIGYFLLKINPFKKIGLLFIYIYFILVTPLIIYSLFIGEKVPGVISNIIYITSGTFAYIVHKSSRKKLYTGIYIIIFVFLTINHNNMMNYYMNYGIGSKIIEKQVPQIEIHDYEGKKMMIEPNNKIQVIDLWSTSCGYCISAFPKFEKLKNDYKNDPEVMFYAVNIKKPKSTTDIKRAYSYVKKFTFNNYFTDYTIYEKLNFLSVPNYMIIGKDGKIKYFGSLNIGKSETYNNIYDLIEHEK